MLYIDDAQNPFQVILTSDPSCDISKACKKRVKIITSDRRTIDLLPKQLGRHVVKVDDKVVELPYRDKAPFIREVRNFVVFERESNS